jgi:hypothetical protein
MTVEQTDEKPINRMAVAQYVAAMTLELAALARHNGLDTLGYLLEMAQLEAEGQAQ